MAFDSAIGLEAMFGKLIAGAVNACMAALDQPDPPRLVARAVADRIGAFERKLVTLLLGHRLPPRFETRLSEMRAALARACACAAAGDVDAMRAALVEAAEAWPMPETT